MERKYRKKSNLINSTGYTPGYASEKNPMNIIPSTDITMENTPYPVYGQPLDQFGNPIAAPTYMEPGYDYNYGDEASYVAEVPAYKDGGKKQAWISEKIGILMGEGRPQKQAIAIAYSMWEQNHEDGGYQLPEYQYAGTVNFGQKPNGFSFYNRPPDFGTTVGYDPKIDPSKYGFGTDSQLSENALTAGEDWKKNNPLPQGMFASNLSDDATKNTTTTDTTKVGATGIHQFYNPYGDIGIGDALYFGGQEFAKGNNWKGAAGVGLGLLKGTKDFLAGMGNQKRQDTIMKSYNENQRKNMTGENRAIGMKNGGFFKKGGNYKGTPQLGNYYQEGGEQEQMGGEMPMPQEQSAGQDAQIQQVMQQVAQMLQQGADPQQVLQQLVQSGIPQDQATQIVQAAMQQSGASPAMKCGGKMYQEGGETEMEEPGENEQGEGENPQQEQIEDQVEAALKQGANPQEVLQQLVQMGMPEQEAVQMIQEILQELQNGEGQEAPEEEEQPEMKNGGNYLEALKGKVIKNYTYNKNTGNYDVEFE